MDVLNDKFCFYCRGFVFFPYFKWHGKAYSHFALFKGTVLGHAQYLSNCSRNVSVSCRDGNQITIRKVNASDGFGMELSMCNGKENCLIDNPKEICFDMNYWCKKGKYVRLIAL